MALIVFTGGARSGKSGAAQRMAERCMAPVTLAVFAQVGEDTELAARIERHRDERNASWQVVEARDSVEWTERVSGEVLVLDCLGTILGMVMGEVLAETTDDELAGVSTLSPEFADEVERRFAGILAWLLRREGRTIVVTNEVGDGVVPAYATGRLFRDVLGRANRSLVERSERAYLVVAGRLIDLSQLPTDGSWPWSDKDCSS